MESTSSPDNGRQSRGLARFWPVHGMPAPAQRQSGEDGEDGDAKATHFGSGDGHTAGEQPVGDTPAAAQRSAQPAQPTAQPAAGPFGPTALTSETQMVALGSRRPPEGVNPGRAWNQGGFPPADSERGFRNGEGAPRHGGSPVPNGPQPPAGSPQTTVSGPQQGSPAPFGPAASSPEPSPFAPGSPFAPVSPFAPHVTARGAAASSAEPGPSQAVAGSPWPASGGIAPAQHGRPDEGPAGPGSGELGSRGPEAPASRGAASVPLAGQGPGRETPPAAGSPPAADLGLAGLPEQSANGRLDPNSRLDQDARIDPNGRVDHARIDPNDRIDANGRVNPARIDPNGRIDADGRVESHGPIALGGPPTPTRQPETNGRAEMPDARPGGGWTSTPTSGVPTVTHSASASVAVPPNPSGAIASAAATPLGGSPLVGAEAGTLTGGGRRNRVDEDEGGHLPTPRRSTTLDDADLLPRPGRRTAPETGDPAAPDTAADPADSGAAASTPSPAIPAASIGSKTDSRVDEPARDHAWSELGSHVGYDIGSRAGQQSAGQPGGTRDAASTTAQPNATSGAPMRPGDVIATPISFWDDEAVTHFRGQWHTVKADFVDDPVAALTRAHDLLTEAVNELTESLLAERDELDPLQTTATPDTESMRMAMRGYRDFLDRILAL